MDRLKAIIKIRKKLKNFQPSIGTWMQIPHPSIAEIMGSNGYDWVSIDMEHGSVDISNLTDLFRALELGNTLPLVRVGDSSSSNCQKVLDAGAGGIIIPKIEDAKNLQELVDFCRWPPKGKRGVGFSRANLFGKKFKEYQEEAIQPLIIPMIESDTAIKNLEQILLIDGVDAIFIGPYDLSASLGVTGQFNHSKFLSAMDKINKLALKYKIPSGIHVVEPSQKELKEKIKDGFCFIAYSIDAVMLRSVSDVVS